MRTQWRTGLGDFSDCLLAGLLVALASVPVVTAPAAFVAGCRVVDRSRRDIGSPLWTTFWTDFRSAARGGAAFALGCLAAVVLFAVDLEVVAAMPGAGVLRPALWVLAVAGVVVAVRTCELVASGGTAASRWPDGGSRTPAGSAWGQVAGEAARETAVAIGGPAESGAAGRWPDGGSRTPAGSAWGQVAGEAARETAVAIGGPAE
ncbi:hypothetical protein, partial [Amycolatopsis tolypomycina]|uniref:hypothetical protein n=1 Tax=Amycolatopsis tolypomycina TaxID=208445 RepID=UPI0033B1A24E